MTPKHTEHLKCEFTDAEIADFARQLARANQSRGSIEQQKKEVDSQLKAEIECQNSIINRLSGLVATGSEYRAVECTVQLDTPENGRKRIVRIDTGEEVKIVPMTDADRQIALDLQEKAEVAEGAIVTPPPTLLRIESGTSGHTEDGAIVGTVEPTPFERDSRRKRKPRDPEAEAIADGTAPLDPQVEVAH